MSRIASSVFLAGSILVASFTLPNPTSAQISRPKSYQDSVQATTRTGISEGVGAVPSEERIVEKQFNLSLRHDYMSSWKKSVRRDRAAHFSDAVAYLKQQGVDIKRRVENTSYVFTDDLPPRVLGQYHPDGVHTPFSFTKPSVVEGGVEINTSLVPVVGEAGTSRLAETVLHEAVHHQVARFEEERRDSLHTCMRRVGEADYVGSGWRVSDVDETWTNGWMSRYARKNVSEDVAETATVLLTTRSYQDRYIFGSRRIRFSHISAYLDEEERRRGFTRIHEKARCLSEYGVFTDTESSHILEAFNPVMHGRLGYYPPSNPAPKTLRETVESLMPQ